MAEQGRETLDIVIGAVMAQSAVLEFLVKQGVIERAPLVEHLAARIVSWERTASPNQLFAIQTLAAILAGRPSPPSPGSTH